MAGLISSMASIGTRKGASITHLPLLLVMNRLQKQDSRIIRMNSPTFPMFRLISRPTPLAASTVAIPLRENRSTKMQAVRQTIMKEDAMSRHFSISTGMSFHCLMALTPMP